MKITKARLREIILEELQKEAESGSLEEFATGRGYDPGTPRRPSKRERCYDKQGNEIPCGEQEEPAEPSVALGQDLPMEALAKPGPSHRERTKKYGVGAKAETSRAAQRDKEYAAEEKKKEDEKKITKESLKNLIRKELLNL